MTTIISEVYDAFREAGVSDDKAKAAARAVIGLERGDEIRYQRSPRRLEDRYGRNPRGHRCDQNRSQDRRGGAEGRDDRALWIQGGAVITILAGIGTLLEVWPR